MRQRCVVVLVVLAGAAASVRGQARPEWKFKKGDSFTVETRQSQKQNVEIMGAPVAMDVETTTKATFKVLDLTKDGPLLEQRIDSVVVDSKGGFGGGGMDKMAEQLKGATFRFTLGPDGKVVKLDGYEEFIKKVGGGGDLTDKMVRATLTEDAVKQMAGEAFGFLPTEEEFKKGKWQRKVTVPLGPLGSFAAEHNYTLGKTSKDEVEIDVASTMTYSPPKEGAAAGLLKITAGSLKAEGAKGKIRFDPNAGRLLGQKSELTMEGSLTIDVGGMGVNMKLKSEQKTEVKVTAP